MVFSKLRGRQIVAGVASAALVVVASAPAMAQSPSPTPSPTTAVESGGMMPLSSPAGPLQASVGQSLQIRMDPDAQANSNAGELKWLATQVTVQGNGSGDVTVPMDDNMFRSLDGFAKPENNGSAATFSFNDVQGEAVGRTIALYPMDGQTALAVSAKFTLDGSVVKAEDIVGKSGVVTAEYTVTNQTTKTVPATFTSVTGEQMTKDVQADTPFVVQATTTLPQRFTGLNTGIGQVGADGLGGNQIMWIGLPFRPLSKDGTATFGWAANVTNGEIPPLMIQAAPVYMPPNDSEAAKAEKMGLSLPSIPKGIAGGGSGAVGADIMTALSGAKEMIGGIKASMGVVGTAGRDTISGVEQGGKDVVAALEQICSPELLNCADFQAGSLNQKVSEAISRAEVAQADLYAAAEKLRTDGAGNQQIVQELEDALKALELVLKGLDFVLNQAINSMLNAIDAMTAAQAQLDTDAGMLAATASYCETSSPGGIGGYTCAELKSASSNSSKAASDLGKQANKLASARANLESIVEVVKSDVLPAIDKVLAALPTAIGKKEAALLDEVAGALNRPIEGLYAVQALMAALAPPLAELKAGMGEIAAAVTGGLKELANLRNTIPAIVSGGGQLKGAMGSLSAEAKGILGQIVTLALTAKDKLVTTAGEAKTVATELGNTANNLKASVTGLEMMAAQSPYPYSMIEPTTGPVTVSQAAAATPSTTNQIPVTTAFGAYQFMLDPANENTVNTTPRIITGVVLLIITCGAGFFLARRRMSAG